QPDTVTLIANFIPLELPDGGPNFYEFSDRVLYAIHIDNDGDGCADISYQFQFTTVNNDPGSFLYNDGPITSLSAPAPGSNWNRQQTYTLSRWQHGRWAQLGTQLLSPPCNIGPRSTPDYASLASQAVHSFSAGGHSGMVFAGQRAEGFYVDLGSVFDLGGLRPFNSLHELPLGNMPGVNSTAAVNVHTVALQVPITDLTRDGRMPTSTTDDGAVIGVWASASVQRVQIWGGGYEDGRDGRGDSWSGPFTQVSRLGNPLVNELIIGIGDKDEWNRSAPSADGTRFFKYFANPLLAQLLPTLYPNVFDNLAAYDKAHSGTSPSDAARPDLVAVLLTGIPNSVLQAAGVAGVVPPTNVGGKGVADMLRLNVAQPPTPVGSAHFSIFGYLEGDGAGYPNGRRVYDDVATIALRAVAGATLPLVTSPRYTPDKAVGTIGTDPGTVISFGLTAGSAGTASASLTQENNDITALGTEAYLTSFPYLGTPYSGYDTPSKTPTDKAS
ncbi:MAG: DUF4331 domain-containing protein, partial [Acidimicrobiales bacterium]